MYQRQHIHALKSLHTLYDKITFNFLNVRYFSELEVNTVSFGGGDTCTLYIVKVVRAAQSKQPRSSLKCSRFTALTLATECVCKLKMVPHTPPVHTTLPSKQNRPALF